MAKINVKGTEVTIISIDEKDYISLTDMVRGIENVLSLIEKWLRNKKYYWVSGNMGRNV